jgi:hypothetical protein
MSAAPKVPPMNGVNSQSADAFAGASVETISASAPNEQPRECHHLSLPLLGTGEPAEP